MQLPGALVTIRSPAQLWPAQKEQLLKIFDVYAKGENLTLGYWKDISHTYPEGFNSQAAQKIFSCVSKWFKSASCTVVRKEHWLIHIAAKDTIRQLYEEANFQRAAPVFPASGCKVRFYSGFDVKVSKGFGMLPVLDQIKFERFQHFSGSIVATGMEIDADKVYCNVLYLPNPDDRTMLR